MSKGNRWDQERKWFHNQDESEWSLNTSLMSRFGALFPELAGRSLRWMFTLQWGSWTPVLVLCNQFRVPLFVPPWRVSPYLLIIFNMWLCQLATFCGFVSRYGFPRTRWIYDIIMFLLIQSVAMKLGTFQGFFTPFLQLVSLYLIIEYWVLVRFLGCLYCFLQHQNPTLSSHYLWRKSSAVVLPILNLWWSVNWLHIRFDTCTRRNCSGLTHCPAVWDQKDCVLNGLEELGN